MQLRLPFCAKELPGGEKLYRRAHGYTVTLAPNGSTTLIIHVPYNACKINEAEVIGCCAGVSVDIKVLDSTSGTYTGVPSYMLNQFGFNVNIAKDYYKDLSPYDADLRLNMQIQFTFINSSSDTPTLGVNVPFHEVVTQS